MFSTSCGKPGAPRHLAEILREFSKNCLAVLKTADLHRIRRRHQSISIFAHALAALEQTAMEGSPCAEKVYYEYVPVRAMRKLNKAGVAPLPLDSRSSAAPRPRRRARALQQIERSQCKRAPSCTLLAPSLRLLCMLCASPISRPSHPGPRHHLIASEHQRYQHRVTSDCERRVVPPGRESWLHPSPLWSPCLVPTSQERALLSLAPKSSPASSWTSRIRSLLPIVHILGSSKGWREAESNRGGSGTRRSHPSAFIHVESEVDSCSSAQVGKKASTIENGIAPSVG